MQHKEEKSIIYIPILLMLSFLLFPLLDQQKDQAAAVSGATDLSEQTGFLAYDLLPNELKKEMKRLQKNDSTSIYYFAYFFDVDDINHRYYMTDVNHQVIKELPVTNQEVLSLVEEKIAEDQGRGFSVSYDTRLFAGKAEAKPSWYNGRIAYIIPEDKEHASFQKLRVGILKEQYPAWIAGYQNAYLHAARDRKTYRLSEVEEAPRPIRGIDYFKEVVTNDIIKNASFLYHDLNGDVVVEFTIGNKAKSRRLYRGLVPAVVKSMKLTEWME